MSYLTAIALLILVISPLLVPVSVTVIHGVMNWRESYERLQAAARLPRRALRPAV